jgi:hypothetical protein
MWLSRDQTSDMPGSIYTRLMESDMVFQLGQDKMKPMIDLGTPRWRSIYVTLGYEFGP